MTTLATFGTCDVCGTVGPIAVQWPASGQHGDLTPWDVCGECERDRLRSLAIGEGLTLSAIAALTA